MDMYVEDLDNQAGRVFQKLVAKRNPVAEMKIIRKITARPP